MSELKICRICLRRNVKLFHYTAFQLKKCYEEILNFVVSGTDKLPNYFCFECAAMLHKFHKFKEKCFKGHKILIDLLKNEKVSNNIIKKLNGKEMRSQLGILTNNVRVQTVTLRDRPRHKKSTETDKETSEPETVFVTEKNEMDDNECKNAENVVSCMNYKEIPEDVKLENANEVGDNSFEEKVNIDKIDDAEVKSKHDVEKVKMFEDVDEKIIEDLDNNMKIEVDEAFSSDDDNLLINLVNNKLNKEPSEIMEQDSEEISNGDNKRKKKGKSNSTRSKLTMEKKLPKVTLDLKYWERRYLNEQEAITEFQKRAHNAKFLSAPYQCMLCHKGFSQEDMLMRHNKLKHAESLGPNMCPFCHSRFKWNCQLNRHMHQHYNIYKCLRCGLVCNLESTALLHEEHHNGVVKKCKYCGEEYTHTSTYYSHLRSHRSSFVCTLCGQSFVSETGLRYHKLLKHVHAEPKQTDNRQAGDQGTYCERCNIQFETQEAYEQHYLHSAMHSVGTDVDGEEDIPAPAPFKARSRTIKRSPRKPRTCPTCQATFRTQTAFFQHRCLEHNPSAVTLEECTGRARKGPTGRSYKNCEKQMCEICGVTVASVYMDQHLNTHTHKKAYPCSVCGVKLYAQSSLKRHQLTHTGERPYPCPLCEKRFTQSNSMKLHYRTFHLKQPYPKRNRRKKEEAAILEFAT